MLYIINIEELFGETTYNLIDTITDSVIRGNIEFLKDLVVEQGFSIANASIVSRDGTAYRKGSLERAYIKLKDWTKELPQLGLDKTKDSKAILLSKINDNEYKVVMQNGNVRYVDRHWVKTMTINNKIVNYKNNKSDSKFEYYDTYTTQTDEEFRRFIDNEYNKFIAKTKLIGVDMSFEYKVEGEEVKIVMYTGNSKEIVLPNFVTCITEQAFFKKKIDKLILNKGLKHIGSNAFRSCQLGTVVIPETVKYIGQWAFYGNDNLHEETETFARLNKETMFIGRAVQRVKKPGFVETFGPVQYAKKRNT